MNALFRRTAAFAALFMALAWPAHELFVHGQGLADNDCQVCAVSLSPELNSDCGAGLLAAPENSVRIAQVHAAPTLPGLLPAAPRGRAPPLN